MVWYANLPYLSIFACMFAAILLSIARVPKRAYFVTVLISGICFAVSLIFLCAIVYEDTSMSFSMGKFPAPFGNEIRFGPLQGVFASCFSGVMLFSLLGGRTDIFEDVLPEKLNLYCVMINMTLASLLALTYTNDMFTSYVFIEISTISACALVMAKDRGSTLTATVRYLFMSLLGSGLFLLGLVILYSLTGHLLMLHVADSVANLAASGEHSAALFVAGGLMIAGLGIKSAMFPFHRWLPDAHGSSTTASSAILSGLVLKGYIALIITLIIRVFTPDVFGRTGIGNVIFVLGLCGMIAGSIRAMRENHIKRMLAYSSVAQVGYIFTGIGYGTLPGITAAAFHVLVHACCKPLLFVCAGRLSSLSAHSKDLKDLRGSAWKSPLAGIGFTVGSLSMVGVPLFAGFVSKFYLAAAGDPGTVPAMIVIGTLVVSSLLNAVYYIPAVIAIWSVDTDKEMSRNHIRVRSDASFAVSAFVLTGSVMALGIGFSGIWNTLYRGLSLM